VLKTLDVKFSMVSILMPLFNSDKWVEEAIMSVQDQTHTNWELIIVDDGSVDNSHTIAKEFEEKDPRITLIKQSNQGACAARNRAFQISKGSFIQYLDSDDILSPTKISEQLIALSKTNDPKAVASCRWGQFKSKIRSNVKNDYKWLEKNFKPSWEWLENSWTIGGHGVVMMWLIPRLLIEKAGYWNEKLLVNQDGEFFCRVLNLASRIEFVEGIKVFYRKDNPNSITKSETTYLKAESLLLSYRLYQIHLMKSKQFNQIQTGLASNYFKFIYGHGRQHKQLASRAKEYLRELPLADTKSIIKHWFHPLASIIGFDNYLILKNIKDKVT
jgi:glycosyltransferase involved in cell wall biosynthesis